MKTHLILNYLQNFAKIAADDESSTSSKAKKLISWKNVYQIVILFH